MARRTSPKRTARAPEKPAGLPTSRPLMRPRPSRGEISTPATSTFTPVTSGPQCSSAARTMRSSELYARSAPSTRTPARTARTTRTRLMAGLSGERCQHRPQRLRLASEGPAGTARVVPRVDVEVRPGHVRGHEVVEEERADDRAREAAAAGVVDVGDVAVVQPPVVAPQRQPPHGVRGRLGRREQPRRELLVVGEERGKL